MTWDDLVREKLGPLAKVRECRLCGFHIVSFIGQGGGRGAGFRRGNRARGQMIGHLKAAHPTEYGKLLETNRAFHARMSGP